MKSLAISLALLVVTTSAAVPMPSGNLAEPADDAYVAMKRLKTKAAALGFPDVKGEDVVAGRTVPDLYFGEIKMNGDCSFVDAVQAEQGGIAALFVKSGIAFVLVTTNVKDADGSRAVGSLLDPEGQAVVAIAKGYAYAGEADILGRTYVTRYEPIRDANKDVVGIYYVGYPKN
jgi:hypothetical protein